jgi:hypothetical protein
VDYYAFAALLLNLCYNNALYILQIIGNFHRNRKFYLSYLVLGGVEIQKPDKLNCEGLITLDETGAIAM